MNQQKVFSICLSYPSAEAKSKSDLAKHNYQASEMIELQPYLDKGWTVQNVYMHTPAAGHFTNCVIVIESPKAPTKIKVSRG